MTTDTATLPVSDAETSQRLPWAALPVMALTGFIIIATETMPAGLLPQIADGLGIREGTAGQLVSAYALGTVLAAIPAITLTRLQHRKPLLLAGLLGFLVTNTVTALAPDLIVTLGARFVAGAFSGLLWGMLAGYARRIVRPEVAGRALAIAMTGTPIALAVGTPLGTWLGATFDWRWSFGAMSLLCIVALILAVLLVPDAPGQSTAQQTPLVRVLGIPGVSAILLVVFVWMLAHNILYTYISSYLQAAHVHLPVSIALVVFGAAAMAGIGLTGGIIDRNLRELLIASIMLFVVAGLVLVVGRHSLPAILVAIVLWGLAFGGAATQLQTAMGEASGSDADVANSILTVSFNGAIFAAGVGGAALLGASPVVLPVAMIGLSVSALAIVVTNRATAFQR